MRSAKVFRVSSPVLWLLLLSVSGVVNCYDPIVLENNGYSGVVVALSSRIHPDPDLLLSLESVFKNASEYLYKVTQNRAYFEEVTVILPKSWSTAINWTSNTTDFKLSYSVDTFRSARVRIEPDGGAFGDRPFTLQYGGCGTQGLRTVLTSGFLTQFANDNETFMGPLGRVLVREWAHLRYGVFDEYGFFDDPLYPLFYKPAGATGDVLITTCNDGDLSYSWIDTKNQSCNPQVNSSSGIPLPNNNCYFKPSEGKNNLIKSSVMAQQFLPNVDLLCTARNHKTDPPTKQNVLCEFKSASEVVFAAKDFQDGNLNNNGKDTTPKFKYVLETEPRIVIIVDSSYYMSKNNRFVFVREAVEYLIERYMNDVKAFSKLGLMSYGTTEGSVKNLKLSVENTASVARTFFSKTEKEIGNMTMAEDAILEAIKLFETDDGNRNSTGGVIMMFGCSKLDSNSVSNLSQDLNDGSYRLYSFLYPADEDLSNNTVETADSVNGRVTFIQEKVRGDGIGDPVSLASLFYTIDDYVLRDTSRYESLEFIPVYKRIIDRQIALNPSNTSFHLDHGNWTKLRVMIVGNDFAGFKTSDPTNVQLFAPNDSAVFSDDDPYAFHKAPSLTYYEFTILNPESGEWTLSTTPKNTLNQSIVITVSAAPFANEESILLDAWISVQPHAVDPDKPFVIYAELRKGIRPVVGARVSASILCSGDPNSKETELIDNGAGDPDITKNDGIYSRYFTGLTKRSYCELTVRASGSETTRVLEPQKVLDVPVCCGSVIPDKIASPTGNFTRLVNYGSFYVMKDKTSSNTFPPSRILDLRAIGTNVNDNQATLQWTAPGGDFDQGKADGYEFRYFTDIESAKQNFQSGTLIDVLSFDGTFPFPELYGTVQSAIIRLRNLQQSQIFFAMKSRDSDGNLSPTSNIVQVFLKGKVITTTTSTTTVSTTTVNSTTVAIDDGRLSSAELGMAIGIPLAVLILLAIGIILFIVFFRKRRRKEPAKQYETRHNSGFKPADVKPTLNNNNINNVANNNNLTSTPEKVRPEEEDDIIVSAALRNPISPVNSWSADVLLDHYEKQKESKRVDGLPSPPEATAPEYASEDSSSSSIYTKVDTNASVRSRGGAGLIYNPVYASSDPGFNRGSNETLPIRRNVTEV